MHSCIHSFMHAFMHSFMQSCMHSFMHSFIYLCINIFIYIFVHFCIHLFIHCFIPLFIHAFIHSFRAQRRIQPSKSKRVYRRANSACAAEIPPGQKAQAIRILLNGALWRSYEVITEFQLGEMEDPVFNWIWDIANTGAPKWRSRII